MPQQTVTPEQALALKVLIAEDSRETVATLTELLDALGNAQVAHVADNEAIAVDWAQSHPADWNLAIVDLMLHEGNGFNVVRRLRQAAAHARIVVFSGWLTEVVTRRCLELGADAVFHKAHTRDFVQFVDGLRSSPA